MCGRYVIEFEEDNIEFKRIIDEINRKYNNTEALAKMKTGEIFPTDTVPVLASELLLMKWGFPRWDNKGVIINARAETVMSKKMFRPSVLSRRCIIPANGFFEWSHGKPDTKKEKYLLHTPDSPVLYMAGFYNREATDEIPPSFVIITTEANKWVSPLHNRMPLILEKQDIHKWISDSNYSAHFLSQPCEAKLSAILQ